MFLRLIFGIVLSILSVSVMAIEEPEYKLVKQEGPYELRGYAPRIVAETMVEDSFQDASSAGFKRIAGYIFGNNVSRSGESEKIKMTAPVSMEPKSEKISMTAPVSMGQSQGKWRVQFFMPREYTIDSLPSPNDSAVQLRTLPASNFAVVRFSGLVNEKKKQDKSAELLNWMQSRDIKPMGEPVLARYNPPWTLPFLRRNEIMVAY